MTDSITISCKGNEDITNSINLDSTTSVNKEVSTTTYPDTTTTSDISSFSDVSATMNNVHPTHSTSNLQINTSNDNVTINSMENTTGTTSKNTEFTTSSELPISRVHDTTKVISSEKASMPITTGNTVKESSERRDTGTLTLNNSLRDIITFDTSTRKSGASQTESSTMIDESSKKSSVPITTGNTVKESSERRDTGTLILNNSLRDIITFDTSTRKSGASQTESSTMIDESNDTAANDMVTATSDPRSFGTDVVAKENRTLLPNFGISFGNDAIRKDTVTSNPAAVTKVDQIAFGNGFILKDTSSETPIKGNRDLLLQHGLNHSSSSAKSTSNEHIFGNEAVTRIYTNVQTTSFGTGTIESDVVTHENKTIDHNLDKTSGNDGIRKDAGTSSPIAFTTGKMVVFGNDAINKDVTEEKHGETTFGGHTFGTGAFLTHGSPISTINPKTFGPDITLGGNQNLDILFENDTRRREIVTSTPMDITSEKNPLFVNVANSNETITENPYEGTKHGNEIPGNLSLNTDAITNTGDYIQTTSFESQTLAPDLVFDESKTFVQSTSFSFGNEAIKHESVTTPSKDRATFGNDAIVKDVSAFENSLLGMTDTVHSENNTFGPDAAVKERATFGNDAIQPVSTVPESTTILRQNFDADTVTKPSPFSTNKTIDSTNLSLHDISNEKTTSSIFLITPNDSKKIGGDAIQTNRVDEFQNENRTFGSDIASKEQTTFGATDTPSVSKFSETVTPTTQSFEANVMTNQSSLSFDLKSGDANQLPGDFTNERTTQYPYISTTSSIQTVGFDAIPKDRGDGFHDERQTFGPDIASKERTTFGNDGTPPVPTVPEQATQTTQSFGADAVTKHNSLSFNSNTKRGNLLLDELTNDTSTSNPYMDTTSIRQSFGLDAIPKVRVDGFQSEKHTFGPDIASKDRITFGNDAIRPAFTRSDTTTPVQQSFDADAVTKQDYLLANVSRERINTLLGDITTERLSTDPNVRQTFGVEAIAKETTTHGSILSNKERTSMFDAAGEEILTTSQQPTTAVPVTSFESNVFEKTGSLMDALRHEALSVAKETKFTSRTDVSSETLPTKVLFENDAIPKDVTSTSRLTNEGLLLAERNIPSFSDNTRHSILSVDHTRDFRNSTGAELLGFDGLSSVEANSTSNTVSTFGADAIEKEAFTDKPIVHKNKIGFGESMVLRETVDSVKVIDNSSVLAKEALIEPSNISLGGDVLKQENLLPLSTTGPKIIHMNKLSLSTNLSPSSVSEVLETTTQDVDITTMIVPFEKSMIDERLVGPTSHMNMEVSPTFANVAISRGQSTVSTYIPNDDQSTPEIPGDFKSRRQFLPTTDSLNVATVNHDSVRPVANDMNNNNIEASVINDETNQNKLLPVEKTAFDHSLSRINSVTSSIDKSIISADFSTTTIESGVSAPVIDETISKQRDSSLLSSINEVRPDIPNTLIESILKTHNETISSFDGNILRALSGNNEDVTTNTDTSTMRSDIIPNDPQISTDIIPRAGEGSTSGTSFSTEKEELSVTTKIGVSTMISKTAASNENDVTNMEVSTIQVSTATEKDLSAETTTMSNFRETTTPITMDATTYTEKPMMKTTKMKSTSTQSTLPVIIPGQQEAFKPTVPTIRRMSTSGARPFTESTSPTTEKIYNVMVGEPAVTDDRLVADGSSNIRSSKDQLNVSLDDETDRSFFNMNNKTYSE